MTPPDALPYSAELGPRMTSIWLVAPRSMLSTEPRPSGSVSGIPSTSTLTPRMPNWPRAPKPRIESAQVLREVVAVLHEQAGHAAQRLVERELLARRAECRPRSTTLTEAGRLVERALEQGGRDDDLLERRFGLGRRLGERCGAEHAGSGPRNKQGRSASEVAA